MNTSNNKLKITQFREVLIGKILGFYYSLFNQNLVPSLISKWVSSSKLIFKKTSEKCVRNEKIRKRYAHCYKDKVVILGSIQACK